MCTGTAGTLLGTAQGTQSTAEQQGSRSQGWLPAPAIPASMINSWNSCSHGKTLGIRVPMLKVHISTQCGILSALGPYPPGLSVGVTRVCKEGDVCSHEVGEHYGLENIFKSLPLKCLLMLDEVRQWEMAVCSGHEISSRAHAFAAVKCHFLCRSCSAGSGC